MFIIIKSMTESKDVCMYVQHIIDYSYMDKIDRINTIT